MPILSIVLVSIPKSKSRLFARQIVSSKLAACVSVFPPVRSIYRWKGKIENQQESLIMIKTMKKQLPRLYSFIVAQHPYEVPEILALDATDVFKPYLKWVEHETVR